MGRSSRRRYTQIEKDITNNAELRANTQNVYAFIRASRPKNTSLVYNPKQEEFKVRGPLLQLLDTLYLYTNAIRLP
jgi:hypothetical protein